MTVCFDIGILKPGEMSLDLAGTSIESGRSMSGITGAIDYSSGGFWTLEYKNIFIENRDQHKYWSYMRNVLTGGVSKVDVQIEQRGSAPIPSETEHVYPVFDGGYSFEDGTSFYAGTVTGFIASDIAVGDSTITITIDEGGEITGGETFSVYQSDAGWKTYSITDVDTISGSTYTVGIRPPSRGISTAGDVMEFLVPKCQMRLAPGSKIPQEIKPPWHSMASISFVEAF